MADSPINPTSYTFVFDSATDEIIIVDNYTFAWSTVEEATGVANFNLFDCGTPSPNFNLKSCDYVSPIMPRIDAYSGQTCNAILASFFNMDVSQYQGAYLDCVLTVNPVDEMEGDVYSGQTADADLLTVSFFRDCDAYHGAYSDSDLEIYPPAELETDNYSGQTADADLSVIVVLPVDGYHGAYSDSDLEIFPSAALPVDGYHGATSELDDILVPWGLGAYHGSYSDADLTDSPSEGLGNTDAYHGATGEGDIAPTFALSADAYSGEYAYGTQLATSTTFNADAYHGWFSDTELTEVLGEELPLDAYHGGYGSGDTLAVTVALFSRNYFGQTATVDIELHPAIEMTLDVYHGASVNIPVLDELNWNTLAYHGATTTFDLALELNLPADAYHGAIANIPFLNYTANLPADAYHGSHAYLNDISVPEGEGLEANAYHGSYSESDSAIPIYPILTPHPIVAGLALYDADHNHNHCDRAGFVDHLYGDNVIRWDWDDFRLGLDSLDFEFADTRLKTNWNPCDSVVTVCDVELRTQPRLQAEAYSGESMETYLPMKIYDFGVIEFENPSTLNFINFEPIFWTKFCHGYIRPNGEAVIFDFDSIDNTGCDGKYYMEHGSNAVFELSVEQSLYPEIIHASSRLEPVPLTFEGIWLLYAHGGEHLSMASNVDFTFDFHDGMYAQTKFYDEPWYGYGGSHCVIDTLTVTGAAVAWVTEADICLPNEYIPLTEDGDLDYDALDPDNDGIRDLPEVAVEEHSFYFPLFAHCVAYEAE